MSVLVESVQSMDGSGRPRRRRRKGGNRAGGGSGFSTETPNGGPNPGHTDSKAVLSETPDGFTSLGGTLTVPCNTGTGMRQLEHK